MLWMRSDRCATFVHRVLASGRLNEIMWGTSGVEADYFLYDIKTGGVLGGLLKWWSFWDSLMMMGFA